MDENLNVAANIEETAAPQVETGQSMEVEVASEPTTTIESESQQTDITQTQSFAKRLKEETTKAEQRALDNFVEQTYGASHGIKTYAEYQEALAKQEQEQKLAELLEQNIPEEYATEMLENRKFREQFEAEQKTKQQQQQQQADMKDFISAFPDVKADEIPAEVWKANANGIPLRYAYAEHALKQTREAEAKAKANAENAKGSMGNVSGDGVANDSDFVTFDSYEKNKSNQSWVNKNFNKIMSSRPKW